MVSAKKPGGQKMEQKTVTLARKVEGVTKEELSSFKHSTHCDTIEELFELIKKESERFFKNEPKSQWERAVRAYRGELFESIFEMSPKALIKAFRFDTYEGARNNIERLLMNGAESWEEYSRGGCSLCYNEDIKERLFSPSIAKKTDFIYRGKDLLSWQAAALEEAAAEITNRLGFIVDYAENGGYRVAARVYGDDGHRQKISFLKSSFYDWSEKGKSLRKLSVINSDLLGNDNQFSLIIADRDTREDCAIEINGQLSDGAFENAKKGRIEKIIDERL